MARGQRTNLAALASAVGDQSPVDRPVAAPAHTSGGTAPLSQLVANPRNPRDDVGDLEDLASIADMQLQPALVVTKKAYQRLYPDDAIDAHYVVINGCRRLAAAHKFGRTDLAIVVNDEVARDHVTLISASIAENVDRQDFDVIEEAKAVDALVQACGRADEAAARLHKTAAWVSQRRALLKLDPELQTALRRGELALREARSLARVPQWQQVARWRAAMENNDAQGERQRRDKNAPSRSRVITEAINQFDTKPEALAEALHTYLGLEGVLKLLDMLSNRTG